MRGLRLDVARANAEEDARASEAYASTPYSSTSYASTSQQTDSGSDQGPETSQAEEEYLIKSESSPNTPAEGPKRVATLTHLSKRSKPPDENERSTSEETRKIRVNGRSKTGCITCRKRKKKCDEAKPFCQNCIKTNYKCEGYQEKRDWRPDGHRNSKADDEISCETAPSSRDSMLKVIARMTLQLPDHQSPSTLPAIENENDTELFLHYMEETSQKITIHTEADRNPWRDLVLPIAKDDQGLMHFVLALAGSHWDKCKSSRVLDERRMYHEDAAIAQLRQRLNFFDPATQDAEPVVASIILHFLMSKMSSSSNRKPQLNLDAAWEYLQPPDTEFWRFAHEFYTHHKFFLTLTSLPGPSSRPFLQHPYGLLGFDSGASSSLRQNFHILIGIADVQLMTLISKITILRDAIRQRQITGVRPPVHHQMLLGADELGREISTWESNQAQGSTRWVAAELYRQAAKLYLLRTVRSVRSSESRASFASCVAHGLNCLEIFPAEDPVQSGLLLPTFILGCGAYDKGHRRRLFEMLVRIEGYGGFENVRQFRSVLETVWRMMDTGDERSWDWESVVHEMGYETLVA